MRCDIVKTIILAQTPLKMEDSGYTAKELIEKAVSIAKQAVNENGHGLVVMDIDSTGKPASPIGRFGILTEHTKVFKEMAMVGEQAGSMQL
ncbi:MAG: hypothetical protein ACLTE2_07215 [Eubacteriales bacterium]